MILLSSFKTHHACPQARRCIQSHCAEEKNKNTDTSTVTKTLLREYPILKFTFPALVKLGKWLFPPTSLSPYFSVGSREVRCLSILEQMQTNIDYRIYSINCRAQSEEWGIYSKIIRKETHFNKDMIVAVVIVINQLQINPPPHKIRNFNGIRTHNLCVSSALLYQLSYEDPCIARGPICWV